MRLVSPRYIPSLCIVVIAFVIALLTNQRSGAAVAGVAATAFVAFVAITGSRWMFSGDSFTGSLDMAQASVKYLYDKASSATSSVLGAGTGVELDPELDTEEGRAMAKLHVGGLQNDANWCFMNSVIQCLASLEELGKWLKDMEREEAGSALPMTSSLLRLFKELNHKQKGRHTHSCRSVIKVLERRTGQRWDGYEQEDAQEFFQQVLLALEGDYKILHKQLASGEKSDQVSAAPAPANEKGEQQGPKIVTPFDGASVVRVGCLSCGETEGLRKGVISSIDVSLDSAPDDFVLEDLISEYCHMETISGVECYRCSLVEYLKDVEHKVAALKETGDAKMASIFEMRAGQLRKALAEKVIEEKVYEKLKPKDIKQSRSKSKQTMFANPTAEIIVVHINRSVFDMRTGYSRKNYSPVKYPKILDMRQFVIDEQDDYNLNPRFPMRSVSDEGLDEGLKYSLKALIIHYGSANFGHYICFRKCENGFWWRISDHSVDLVSESEALNSPGVFLLFYERVRAAPASTTTTKTFEIDEVTM